MATTRKADECVMNDFIWEYTGWGMSSVHKGNYINEAFEHSNKDLNPVYKYYGIGTGWGCVVERESRHTEDKEEAMEKAETGWRVER